jgi:AraC-like DNA-binding protein
MSQRQERNRARGSDPRALARAIEMIAQSEGDYQTAVPQLTMHRRDAPTEPLHCIYNLGVAVLAQGEKQILLGPQSMAFRPGESMLTTVDVPAVSHVSGATAREPFLGVMLLLDARSVMQAAADLDLPLPGRDGSPRSISVHPIDAALLDAFVRLVKISGEPEMVPRLAPLIVQEITLRLLTGPHGAQLRHLVTMGSPSQQIAKTIAWLRKHFVQPLRIDDLAAHSHMSPSTFRQHFRSLTGVSPVQFQKQLRLQEARQLMLTQTLDAGTAAVRVGYESASQFSREYRRLFGAPPQRDIKRLRLNPQGRGRGRLRRKPFSF